MSEFEFKVSSLREELKKQNLDAVILRRVDWLAWALCGARTHVLLSSERAIASLVCTRDGRVELWTDEIEANRLRDEEVPQGIEIRARPWINAEPKLVGRVASDLPQGEERALPLEFRNLRLVLHSAEQDRLRAICLHTSRAVEEALDLVSPRWTENRVAAEAAKSLWQRGLEPALIMVAGESRLSKYRHPLATNARVASRVMLVVCARAFGLYANLTRFRFFSSMSESEADGMSVLKEIEELAWRMSAQGETLDSIYSSIKNQYKQSGFTDQIERHHQGGITGYLAREEIARPGIKIHVQPGMALAFNPSLTGLKREETVLVHPGGEIEVLTQKAPNRRRFNGAFDRNDLSTGV